MIRCERIESKGEVRWVARVSLGGSGNRRVQRRVNERTRAACEASAAKLKLGHTPSASMSVDDYFNQHFIPNSPCRESTKLMYTSIYRASISPMLGGKRMDKVTPADVQAWATALNSRVKPITAAQHMRVLRSRFNGAVTLDLIGRNPAAKIVMPRVVRTPPDRWSADEARRFLVVTRETVLYDLWCLLLESGVRIGEALALMPSDISVRNNVGVVSVTKSMVASEDGEVVGETKTGRHRDVEISEELATRLAGKQGRFLFAGTNPLKPRTSNSVRGVFHRAVKMAGVPDINLHGLRHTSASLQIELGVPLQVVQHRLGHSSLSMTTHYARINDEMSASAARSLASMLRSDQ